MGKQKIVRNRNQSLQHQQQPLFLSQQMRPAKQNVFSLRKIHHNYATLPINPEQGLSRNKEHIIKELVQQFRHKLNIDMSARQAIDKDNKYKHDRLKQIEAEIQAINNENQLRIEQLAKVEENTLKKIQKQLLRDKEIEEKLISLYEQTRKEGQKINITQHVKHIREKEDWLMLDQQRKRLELLARSYEKKQLELARDKSLVPKASKKFSLAKEDVPKHIKPVKKERKKKNVDEIKQIGRQFLEHAKKVQAERVKANTKMLDVGKKSIDYLPQIKSILRNHGKDLSRPMLPDEVPSPRLRNGKSLNRLTK